MTMLRLQLPTDPRWAALVEADLSTILVDHAWCEHKAASNAMSLVIRYPECTDMVLALAELAQEELGHFHRVVHLLQERGWPLGTERKDHYANQLLAFVRKDGSRTERMVDRLLFSALIEARSCERFKLLSEWITDPALRKFYRDLMESEAGHYTTFISFARQYGQGVDVERRWREYLAYESDVIASYGKAPTMHG